MFLWRFHTITGYWKPEGRAVTEETAQQWLDIYRRDDPSRPWLYTVGKRKPTNPPVETYAYLRIEEDEGGVWHDRMETVLRENADDAHVYETVRALRVGESAMFGGGAMPQVRITRER